MKQIVQRIATSRTLWAAAVMLLIYGLVGYFAVPYLIERSLPRYVHESVGARAAIGKVRFNPVSLELEVNDFRLDSREGRPLAAFDRLFVDLEVVSLLRWAWTFDDVQLEGARLDAEIRPDGHFNLAELSELWLKAPFRRPDAQLPRIVVRHLGLRAGTFTFTDFSQPKGATATSDAINLDVTDLATIPDRDGRYAVSAKLPDGATLLWQGELSLLPIDSRGELRIDGLRLATLWPFFRDELRIAEPGGILSFAGRYDFSYAAGATTLRLEGIHSRIAALSIAQEGAPQPMLALETVEASDARFDLATRELIVGGLALRNGTAVAARIANGEPSWQALLRDELRTRSVRKESRSYPVHVRADAITIDNVGLRYTDTTGETPLEYAASLHADFGLDIARVEQATEVTVRDARLTLADASLKVAPFGDALAELKSIVVGGGHLDTTAHTVVIDTLAIKGGQASVTRIASGVIPLLQAFSSAQPSPGHPVAPDQHAKRQWQYVVHSAEVADITVKFVDRSYKPSVHYDVEIAGGLKNIASDASSRIDLRVSLRVLQGGRIDFSGQLAQDFTRASVRLEAAGVAAEPLRPLLARYTTLDLRSGNVSASARLDYDNGGKPVFRVDGVAHVADFLVNEADTGHRFLSWKMLQADNVALTVSPNRLTVKEIRIQEPGAKIVVAKDRTVNVTQVLKRRIGSQVAKTRSDRFPVHVARVGLQHGTLDFSDNSLVLPFTTRVSSLNGAIVGLSSSPQSRAELRVDGLVSPSGSASAVGSLKLLDPTSFLDISVRFDNVEMAPLSPYTATFAGRKVAAGRLSLDVLYKVVNSQLLGENKLVLADFQLGERVQAPTALDLPLDLAVALLREPDGRIRLAVPVTGDLDNPLFDYGALIRHVIAQTLTRIVSAPFRFIAELLGGHGDDDLQSIIFDPGSARLMPSAREQLKKVAQALKERPSLKLVVHGAYDAQRDAAAQRDKAVRRAVTQALDVKLQSGEDPGPIAYDDRNTQRALEKLLSARGGDDAMDRFSADYAKATGKEPQRVDALPAVFQRSRGDRALYQALFEHLVRTEPLADTRLTDLAAQRAQAIADCMAQTGIDSRHVEVGDTRVVRDLSKPIAATLALEAA